MPENPHEKIHLDKETEKFSEEKEKISEKPSSDKIPTTRSYYYDDACGYEIYTDEDDDDDER